MKVLNPELTLNNMVSIDSLIFPERTSEYSHLNKKSYFNALLRKDSAINIYLNPISQRINQDRKTATSLKNRSIKKVKNLNIEESEKSKFIRIIYRLDSALNITFDSTVLLKSAEYYDALLVQFSYYLEIFLKNTDTSNLLFLNNYREDVSEFKAANNYVSESISPLINSGKYSFDQTHLLNRKLKEHCWISDRDTNIYKERYLLVIDSYDSVNKPVSGLIVKYGTENFCLTGHRNAINSFYYHTTPSYEFMPGYNYGIWLDKQGKCISDCAFVHRSDFTQAFFINGGQLSLTIDINKVIKNNQAINADELRIRIGETIVRYGGCFYREIPLYSKK
jgi:hypothetical protein